MAGGQVMTYSHGRRVVAEDAVVGSLLTERSGTCRARHEVGGDERSIFVKYCVCWRNATILDDVLRLCDYSHQPVANEHKRSLTIS